MGCGDGLIFDSLSRFGDVEGLEPDASLLSDSRWRDRIAVAPLDSSFGVKNRYDLILMLDVLEHIADDQESLAAAWKALRPGGHLLLTVPALSWLWSRHDEANAHHRRYGRGELRNELSKVGFVVEEVRYFFFWTVLPLLARRWLCPAGEGATDYDVPIPAATVNRILTTLSLCDHALARTIPWPVGSSLLAVARRPLRTETHSPVFNPNFDGRVVALRRDPRRIG